MHLWCLDSINLEEGGRGEKDCINFWRMHSVCIGVLGIWSTAGLHVITISVLTV